MSNSSEAFRSTLADGMVSTSPGIRPDTIERAVQRRMEHLSAKTLGRFALGVGLLLVVMSGFQMLSHGVLQGFAWQRGLMGLMFLAGWAGSRWLAQRPAQEWVGLGVLLVCTGALTLHAYATGLGVHSFALAAQALAVGLAGVLVSMRTAIITAVFTLGSAIWLWHAESRGLAPLGPGYAEADQRLVGIMLLLGATLVATHFLARVVTGSLRAALVQERQLAQLVRLGSDWVWRFDVYGRLVELSRSFEDHTGRKVSEFKRLGQDGGPKRVRDEQDRKLRKRLKAQQPFRDLEITFRATDGFELITRVSGEPIFDEAGQIAGWRGVGRSITAEVLAQREAQENRALVDRLFHASADPLLVVRQRDGAVILANDEFSALCGVPTSEVLGRNAVELGLWADEQPMLDLRAALQQAASLKDYPVRLQTPMGARELLLSGTLFDWKGEKVAIHTLRDITHEGRDRRELTAILQHASTGIALVRNRNFERVNPVFERMFGREGLAGQSTRMMFSTEALYAEFLSMSDTLQGAGKTLDIEREVARPDGSRVLLRLRASAVDPRDPSGSGSIWVAEDITESRRAASELAAAQQAADAANRAKSAFLATMSHEIRTPLHGVLGLASLIENEQSPIKREQYLGRLVESAQALGGLVSDVLDLSKIEAGRLVIERKGFDLPDLLSRVFEGNAVIGRERGLEMSLALATDLPQQVMGDAMRLRQILVNFLSNALKFTDRGRISLGVSARGERLRFAVTDTGVGVPLDAIDSLFQPFTQADSSSTRRYGGTGLGLSICRELAQAMGGEVGVESQPGRGSTFWVELPLPTVMGTTAPPRRTDGAHPLSGLRVLVAEDNPVNTLILQAQLHQLGVHVITAPNGREAVLRALDALPGLDAVLMDLHMPVLDGWAAAEQLRADPRAAQLPIVAVSAASLSNERERALAVGMDAFITKPCTAAELAVVLMNVRRPVN